MCLAKKTITIQETSKPVPAVQNASAKTIQSDKPNIQSAPSSAPPIAEEQQQSNVVIGKSVDLTTNTTIQQKPKDLAKDDKAKPCNKTKPGNKKSAKKTSKTKTTNEESNNLDTCKILHIDQVKNSQPGATSKLALLSPSMPQPHLQSSEFVNTIPQAPKIDVSTKSNKHKKNSNSTTTASKTT